MSVCTIILHVFGGKKIPHYLYTDKIGVTHMSFVNNKMWRMIIKRNAHVNQLLAKRWNGKVKIYIQSALNIDTPEKKVRELFSLKNTGDFLRKIVVLDGNSKPWTDEDGVLYKDGVLYNCI